MELAELWSIISKFVGNNSAWIIAFGSAVVGSVTGSWWNQRAIDKQQRITAGRAELRAINRAILVCFSVVNTHMSLKKQHIIELVSDYSKCQTETNAVLKSGSGVVTLSANMTSIPHPRCSATRLEDLMFTEINASGRPLVAATALVDSQQNLIASLALRNTLIEEFRTRGLDGRSFAEIFLALKQDNGNVDSRYQDCLKAIEIYTDDCIFFAMVAAYDLRQYGERLIRQHRGRIGSIRKNLHDVDWSPNKHPDLLPKSAKYTDWTKGFIEIPKFWQLWKKPMPMPLPF